MAQNNVYSFRFLRLKILQGCKAAYVRNLEIEKDYCFIDGTIPYDFFDRGVNVSAVVGKNGSGKSSLLNLIYLVLNNVGAVLVDNECPKPKFVQGVCVELWFEVDGQECVIVCLDDEICFRGVGSNRWAYSCTGKLRRCLQYGRFRQANLSPSGKRNALDRFSNTFPYTITANYSMMGFVGEDLNDAENARWMSYAYEQCMSGYQYPLQLLPWKVRNRIDFEKEKKDSNQRMLVTALMLYQKGCNILPEYEYHDISFEYNDDNCQRVLLGLNKRYGIRILQDVTDNTIERNIVGVVLKYLGIPLLSGHELRIRTLKILLFLEVVKQLPRVDQEKIYCNHLKGGVEFNAPYLGRKIRRVCDDLQKNQSWNAHEFHRLYNFLSNTNVLPTFMKGKFSYKEYYDWLSGNVKKDSQKCVFTEAIRLSRSLPPNSYDSKIMYADADGTLLSISDFSGGQKQFVYQVSTILYHIFNLMPAHNVDPKYRMFNIIIDEVELCLHPDYQRSYLYWLLYILERLNMKDALCRYNIMLVTHSPFVLSDIPRGNILYLENGHVASEKESFVNPFGANVNDILRQSFFMDKGFMGEFVRKKILSLLDFLTNPDSREIWDSETAKFFIESIGEPLIKERLKDMLKDKFKL